MLARAYKQQIEMPDEWQTVPWLLAGVREVSRKLRRLGWPRPRYSITNPAAVGRARPRSAGQQALLVVAYLRKGETYSDLAIRFGIGTTEDFRY